MSTLATIGKLLFGGQSPGKKYSRIISTDAPLFSTFGRDISASDIVKTAIHRIAEAASKCVLRSVVEKTQPAHAIEPAADEINALFTGRVNGLVTLKDFLYKVAYLTTCNENCFIFPTYEELHVAGGGLRRRYTGFYPLEVSRGEIYHNGVEWRIELSNNLATYDMPYSDIIHIRHAYGAHPFLGGDRSGRFDARGLLQNLQVIQTVKEAIPKSLEASLSLKGLLTMRGLPDADKQELKRDEFEDHILNSKYGIAATDYEADFTPINIAPTDLPAGVMNFVQQEILYPFGVSLPIMAGKFNDEEYAAFYQTTVEGLLISISQAFTAALFTPRELAFGHKIKAYDRLTQSLSIEKRIHIAEMTKDDALLEADERRELLGYEPNGTPTRVSLNYIDASIANTYQMSNLYAAKGGKEGNKQNAE